MAEVRLTRAEATALVRGQDLGTISTGRTSLADQLTRTDTGVPPERKLALAIEALCDQAPDRMRDAVVAVTSIATGTWPTKRSLPADLPMTLLRAECYRWALRARLVAAGTDAEKYDAQVAALDPVLRDQVV